MSEKFLSVRIKINTPTGNLTFLSKKPREKDNYFTTIFDTDLTVGQTNNAMNTSLLVLYT